MEIYKNRVLISLTLTLCLSFSVGLYVVNAWGGNSYGLEPNYIGCSGSTSYMMGWSEGWENTSSDIKRIEAGISLWKNGIKQGSHWKTGQYHALDTLDSCKHPTSESYVQKTYQDFEYYLSEKDQSYHQQLTWN